MKYLLDTHVLIWFLNGDKSLSSKARKAIESDNATNFSPLFVFHFYHNLINKRSLCIVFSPAGLHQQKGGHAFGLNKSAQKITDCEKLPIADWEELVVRWLRTIKMMPD